MAQGVLVEFTPVSPPSFPFPLHFLLLLSLFAGEKGKKVCPHFQRTKTAQLSQFELRSVWQSRKSREPERERERERRRSKRRGEERETAHNVQGKGGGGGEKRREKKEERESLYSGSGSTSFLAPQWETMKY